MPPYDKDYEGQEYGSGFLCSSTFKLDASVGDTRAYKKLAVGVDKASVKKQSERRKGLTWKERRFRHNYDGMCASLLSAMIVDAKEVNKQDLAV